jgi:hypothetical protein
MKLVLAVLAGSCVVVGLMWALRWVFEGRVLAGDWSPDDALLAMDQWIIILTGACTVVAAVLAGLLLHLARDTRRRRQWPPSGRWPAPRPIGDAEARTIARRLYWAAGAALFVAVAAALSFVV